MRLRDKRLVAASFSRAARRYDQVAQLQRDIADRLATWLSGDYGQILDLGSGTGYANPQLTARTPHPVISLDLAEGMLSFARERGVSGHFVAGDAEALPLASGSVDLIWSSLALQWSQQPGQLFGELARVLRPGGTLLISTLGKRTLHELKAAWAVADEHDHVNHFYETRGWLNHAGEFRVRRHAPELRVQSYSEVSELLRELKTLGAHNVNPQRRSGLGGQSSLKRMMRAYEAHRRSDGSLPATYEVHYLELIKA